MRNLVKLMDLEKSHHCMLHDLFCWYLANYRFWSFDVVRLEEMVVD